MRGRAATRPRPIASSPVSGPPPTRPRRSGSKCHAGHGLDYDTARLIAALPQIVELNIGHFLIGEAIFVGLAEAVKAMRAAMDEARGRGAAGLDHRHRQRHLRDPRASSGRSTRYGERFVAAVLHRDRAAQVRRAGRRARPPTPSASPPRRPAPRRWAPACGAGCSGATWEWSTCRPASRPCA